MIALPIGGRAVLINVAAGRSPWEGWDAAEADASRDELADAYAARREAIRSCRDNGLLDEEGLLTDDGQTALKLTARAYA